MPAGPPPAMTQRTETCCVAIGTLLPRPASKPGGPPRPPPQFRKKPTNALGISPEDMAFPTVSPLYGRAGTRRRGSGVGPAGLYSAILGRARQHRLPRP